MIGKTHLVAGIIAGELVIMHTQQYEIYPLIFSLFAASIGSLLPDIDHPEAMLSNSSKVMHGVSKAVSAVTPHRGFTHTIVFTCLMTVIFYYLAVMKLGAPDIICYSFGAGIISHLILDTFNEKGVMWIWPVSKKHIHLAKIKTRSRQEKSFRNGLNIIATLMLGYILFSSIAKITQNYAELQII